MGNKALRHNHGTQLGEMGWLSAPEMVVGSPGNSFTISPYFGPSAPSWCGCLAATARTSISISECPTGRSTPIGRLPADGGVSIRLGGEDHDPHALATGDRLLDATPTTTGLADARCSSDGP